jgi:hypothetical protein
LRKSRQFRLLTTDGEPASTQSGSDRPSVVASNFTTIHSGRGSRPRNTVELQANPTGTLSLADPPAPEPIVTNSIQYRTIGTNIELVPRIDASGSVHVQLTYSSSDLESSSDVALTEIPGRKPIMADTIVTCQVQSSVQLKSGTAVVVQSDAAQSTEGESSTGKTRLLILAASVQPALE